MSDGHSKPQPCNLKTTYELVSRFIGRLFVKL